MTIPSSQAGNRPAQGTLAEALRAAADFIESSGQRSGVIVTCSAEGIRIRVSEPYGDGAARHVIVTRLAGLIGGSVRQEDERDFATADLRADGTIGNLRAVVSAGLDVRRTRPRTRNGRPLAEAPGGQITAVPGKLPDGWRWVTELDPEPGRASPRKQCSTAPAPPAAEAPALAARDCPPLTGAALQAAARQEQATTGQPARPGSTARRAPAQPPW
jgi:hypothetical protein